METHITVQEELLRFLRAAALGASCGVLFDFLRFLRALLPHGAVVVFLEDALFSFMFCFVLQVDAWSFCGGSLRFQHFLAMCLGFTAYLLTVGRVTARIMKCLRQLRSGICRLYLRIVRRFRRKTEKISETP